MKSKLFTLGLALTSAFTLGTALTPSPTVFADKAEQEPLINNETTDIIPTIDTYPLSVGNDEVLNFFTEEDRDLLPVIFKF